MPDIEYRNQVIYMLIQDLAELWLADFPDARALHSVPDGQFKKIAKKILDATGVSITSKSLRNYVHGQIGEHSLLDLIAAAWLVATRQLDRKEVQTRDGGTIEDRFAQSIA